jgi:hypothetical protein
MIRLDERTTWNGFLSAEPSFAGEDIATSSDGPDPPDFICTTASGRTVGVELTKWIENAQITASKKRESFENSYLKIVASENEPRPDRIGQVDSSMNFDPAALSEPRHEEGLQRGVVPQR